MAISHKLFDTVCKGFSKLKRHERLDRLCKAGYVNEDDLSLLTQSVDPSLLDINDHLVENVIGSFTLPLGIATNFIIDNTPYLIPMAVEESSIIAAASRNGRWVRENGRLYTHTQGQCVIGQIQVTGIHDLDLFRETIQSHKETLIREANRLVAANLKTRGGGVKDLLVRTLPTPTHAYLAVPGEWATIHVLLDPVDSMGANAVTQVCEYLKPLIGPLTNTTPTIAIVSNLNDIKLTKATVEMDTIDPQQALAIEEASRFAEIDPYRAATHNKGVLNGIDPILIATGNDWRAVEANIHAYAAQGGQYTAITRWRKMGSKLVGQFEAPITVGTVGGVTTIHPMARFCLRLMNIRSAEQLARVIAAVGLVQNLGALRALTGQGLIQGHMKLHINNLMLAAGAQPHEETSLSAILEAQLKKQNKISLTDAHSALNRLREKN